MWTPGTGFLGRRPRVSVVCAGLGLATAALVLGLMVAAPLVHGVAGRDNFIGIFFTYVLASNNRFFGGPYAFFWSAPWMYAVGSLTPLIAVSALLALVGGYYALPAYRRASIVSIVAAACLLVAFMAGEIYVLWTTRNGLPV